MDQGIWDPVLRVSCLGFHQGYLCEARGVHKEVHRAAFQGMHKQSVEILVRMCHSKLLRIYVIIFLN